MPVFNFGGGAGGLALKVKTYDSFPETAAENTIGVISANEVTDYVLAGEAPADGLVEGLLWIKTGANGVAPVPVDARERVTVYPLHAEQYVSGAWVQLDPDALKVFKDGAWTALSWPVYTNGVENVGFAIGAQTSKQPKYLRFRVNYNTDVCTACTTQKIDVTDYNYLCVEYSRDDNKSSQHAYVGLHSAASSTTAGEPNVASFETMIVKADNKVEKFDISARVGEQAIKAYARIASTNTFNFYIHRIWLEG